MKSLHLVVVGVLQLPLVFAAAPQTYPSIFVPVKAGVCIDPDNYGSTFHDFVRTADTMVSGRVMYQSNQNTGKLYQLDASCNSQTYQELYNNLPFSSIASYTLTIASYLWSYVDTPTHQITDDGKIRKWLHSYDERFWVFGIGICTGFICEPTTDGLRSTGNMFLQPNWSGPSSPGYPTDRMLLFNVEY
ncbi:hypothetical protein MUCCIDRAFT_84564 [Mucor lusitanicus CBS 277.49]|uniref:Uncharacterized protein n=1 Tax=Mucor lusitanicus CBS 277.49 TaxID=747725 RepID=A0A168I7F2_MUCCL|nr:hypothetical protein MUCCIDRAFT_84564 [Mucor lusitanicus CBS 277.49]